MDMNSKILAKVDATVITEADVDETIAALGQRGEAYNNPQGRKAVLEQLINKNLLLCEAKKNLYEYDPKFKAELAKIKDESVLAICPEDYKDDISLRGEFVRAVFALDLSEEDRSRVLSYGLRALAMEDPES